MAARIDLLEPAVEVSPPALESSSRFFRRLALVIVLAVFLGLSSAIAINTAPWQNADEPGHFQNIETLVAGHWYGIPAHCRTSKQAGVQDAFLACSGDEAHQAPLYYLVMAGLQRLLGIPAHSLPHKWETLTSPEAVARDRGLLLSLRFANIALGALTVVVTYAAASRASRDRWTPLVAAAVVAFFPQFIFHTSSVTNDNLLCLLGAALTYGALRAVQTRSALWMVTCGVLFGLMVTTKLSTLPLGLLLPLLAFLMAEAGWRQRVWLGFCGVGAAFAVSSWYLVQNWLRYGDPLAARASNAYLVHVAGLGTGVDVPYVVTDPVKLVLVDVPRKLVVTFWYNSWWGEVTWSWPVDVLITVVVVAVMFGLFGQHLPRRTTAVIGSMALLSFACVWVVAFQTASYSARIALVGVGSMGVLVALALQRWSLPVRALLPLAELTGAFIALRYDILGNHW